MFSRHLLGRSMIASALAVLVLCARTECASISVRDTGAIGDGKKADTAAIQKAIDQCALLGGGTVSFPAGVYLSAPIFLKSNITLCLEAGATLLGRRVRTDYPVIDGRWEGIERQHYAALVTGKDLQNVAIEGHGTIDGQGDAWWSDYKQDKYPRPRLINLINCKRVRIRDVKLTDSPSWTVHPVYCEDVVVDGVAISNPPDSPNTDGINPDSCRDVRISNCLLSCGDDCIAIKSGKDADGRRVARPCENITVTNCVMHDGHGGVVIGSEMSGGVRNVTVSNCVFIGTQRGIRIKTQRGRGGVVENCSYSSLVMQGLSRQAILITAFYNGGAEGARPMPVTDETPILRNISFSNIRADGAAAAIVCEGLPELPVSGLWVSGLRVSARQGAKLSNVTGVDLIDMDIRPQDAALPVVTLTQSSDANLRGCRAGDAKVFLRVVGEGSSAIEVNGCPAASANCIEFAGAPREAVHMDAGAAAH